MKTTPSTVLLMLAFLSLAPTTTAETVPLEEGTVSVTLELDATDYTSETLQEFVSCDVAVPQGSVLADVLDQAVLDSCINTWTWKTCASCITAGYGRQVIGLDGRIADCTVWVTWLVGVDPPLCTWYRIQENGEYANFGVDHLEVTAGSTYTFVFENHLAPALP